MPEVVEKSEKPSKRFLIQKTYEVDGSDHLDAAENLFCKEAHNDTLVYWVTDVATRETKRIDLAEVWNVRW